ncbi:carbonic anhydrase family protein [Aquimarina sp. 2201CG5-10]|uniref:carbonic anhydrase n=1 Tax=Aquimarina callyspongiae TaxID=3098150 RepID=UPI002AB5353F|nr:carbonic anhydrase family protein [Aquimarina sp. 2201CG5-10]MDY8134560.1 carbonic anhydrase family protein [Aquimarina sp. 2201CG5-10]
MRSLTFKTLSVLAIAVFLISCENEQIDNTDPDQNIKDQMVLDYLTGRTSSDCHFEYEGSSGPDNWFSLCNGAWSDCGGNVQSPINIVTNSTLEDDSINNINTNYAKSSTDIFNNGHTIQFNYNSGSYASLGNIDYNLLQFHFHTGSEHTVDGLRYPMEMHLVHQDPTTGLLAVVGIFFTEGRENEALAQFMDHLPENEDDHYTSSEEYDIKDILPDELDFYTYNGSLTTPPCSEIVSWYVVKAPVEASHEQLERFEHIMHENFRPVQILDGRTVRTNDD